MGTLIVLLIGMAIGWVVPQPEWVKTLFDKFINWIKTL